MVDDTDYRGPTTLEVWCSLHGIEPTRSLVDDRDPDLEREVRKEQEAEEQYEQRSRRQQTPSSDDKLRDTDQLREGQDTSPRHDEYSGPDPTHHFGEDH